MGVAFIVTILVALLIVMIRTYASGPVADTDAEEAAREEPDDKETRHEQKGGEETVEEKTGDAVLTGEFKEILRILNSTPHSIFISGKAGTGKSYLLQYFTERTAKQFVVLAPTGIAALNVKGQTIHSFFRFPGGIIHADALQPDPARRDLFQNLEMVIIDEVSMVRADLMDGIDQALRTNRNRKEIPFGGVQMVFIGDLYQLPPVVAGNELSQFIQTHYGGEYFFNAPVFRAGFQYIRKELTHVFRQQDDAFRLTLGRIRENKAGTRDFALLNSRYVGHAGGPVADAVYLTTTNSNVRKINQTNLAQLSTPECVYRAAFTGKIEAEYDRLYARLLAQEITQAQFEEQLDGKLPADVHLKLKLGAQVMFIKNDPLKRWVNGTVGKLVKLDEDAIRVRVDGKTYPVEREQWSEITYEYDPKTKSIKEQTKGTFRQFPLKLAWAMTIHKSQGKTFDRAVIDMGSGAFAHGQTYVALSRCRTLEGIRLNRQIGPADIIVDQRVAEYYRAAFGNCVKK
ncbi:MAG: AAA family ATPase [Cytophagales bacterium]|nr:AAA family ATPase [Cytophagales bacterium]